MFKLLGTGVFAGLVAAGSSDPIVVKTCGLAAAINAVAVLPGTSRFVSGSTDGTAKLWTLDGELERTFEVGSNVLRVAALPDGAAQLVRALAAHLGGQFEQLVAQAGLGADGRRVVAAIFAT